jgi:hypothetical protein
LNTLLHLPSSLTIFVTMLPSTIFGTYLHPDHTPDYEELMNSDIKQARQLLQNLIQTNPKHAPGWIAAASLEGKLG